MPHPRIAMFCSSSELGSHVERLASPRGLALETHVAALDAAVPLARELAASGLCDVIVACRGTANLLARELALPVVAVQPAALELVSALFELAASHSSVFVPRYVGEASDFAFIEAQTGLRVHTAVYGSLASLERIVAQSSKRRLGPVVGGGRACALAARLHAEFKIVMPGQLELSLALDAAQALAESMARRRSAMAGVCALLDGGRSPAAAPVWSHPQTVESASSAQAGAAWTGQAGGARPASPAGAGLASRDVPHVASYSFDDYLHASDAAAAVLERMRRFALSGSSVLITGERGTGKAMLAHGLHRASSRAHQPFVAVDCATVPADMLASRLFGTADGPAGLFQQARGGTLFLNQADAMPPAVQTALLRVLQSQEEHGQDERAQEHGRESGAEPCPRIVAASRRPMAEAVREGRLRAELYFRLNALSVRVPPLRERTEDIPLYVEAFVESASREAGYAPLGVPSPCMERLLRHPWPGNARQLKRFCEILVARCQGRFSLKAFDRLFAELELSADRPAPAVQKSPRAIQLQPQVQPPMVMPRESLLAVPQTERRLAAITPSQVDEALRCAGGRKKDAAVLLGISRTSLWRLIRSRARVQES